MALDKVPISIVMTGGLDQGTDKKIVPMGKLLVLENGQHYKNGTASKSAGFVKLSNQLLGSESTIQNATRPATYKDELIQIADGKLYSYVSSNDAWADKGYVSNVSVSVSSVVNNTAQQTVPDVAVTRGIAVYAWEDSRGGVRASVIDLDSGLPLQSDVAISATGSRPKVSATANYLYVHFMDSSNTFKCRRLNPGAPLSFESAITLASDANGTNPNFDIAPFGNNLVVSYETTGDIVKTGFIKQDGDIAGVADGFPAIASGASSGSSSIAVTARFVGDANDAIYCFYHNATDGLLCDIYPTNLSEPETVTVDAATTIVNNIGAIVEGSLCRVWYEVNAAETYNVRIKYDAVTRGGTVESSGTSTGTGNDYVRSVGLASKPFLGADGSFYVVAAHDSDLQPSYFSLRHVSATRAVVANSIAKEQAGGLTARRSSLAKAQLAGDSEFLFPALVKPRLFSEDGIVFGLTGVQAALLSFKNSTGFGTSELGQNVHIAGGLLQEYDGKSVFESGFFLYPENIENEITTTTGDLEAGARQYCVVYEWIDNQGQIHRSAPSLQFPVTNAVDDKNTLTIPTLRLTERKSEASRAEVSIAVYRTTVNGTIFYRVSSVLAPVENDAAVDTVEFEDNEPDTDITSNEILYTTGDVLENIQPTSSPVIADYGDRLVLSSEDQNVVQFSKKVVKGEAVAFSDQTFRADQGGRTITAIAKMDEKLLVFKDSRILVQIGEGPTDLDTQNDFRTPVELPSDVGCPHPHSIVVMPLGVMFKSQKGGYYLLNRGLSTEYVGQGVEDFNSLTVSGAVLHKELNQVRFTHTDGACLVFDYEKREWSTKTGLEAVGSTLWQGTYCVLKSDGSVLRESNTTFLKAGTTVKTRIRTPWIKAQMLQGAQRIYRFLLLGQLQSKHMLRVKVYYDYLDSPQEQFIFDSEDIFGANDYGDDSTYGDSDFFGAVASPYQLEILPKLQKCQAFSIEVDDLNPEGVDGAGFSLTAIECIVGVKRGQARLRPAQRGLST